MTAQQAPPLESVLEWHADLLAAGEPERAAVLSGSVSAVDRRLLDVAAAASAALAPVGVDAGFRRNLRAQLFAMAGEEVEVRRGRVYGWARAVARPADRAWRAASRALRAGRAVGGMALVFVAAAWWWLRMLRRLWLPRAESLSVRYGRPGAGA